MLLDHQQNKSIPGAMVCLCCKEAGATNAEVSTQAQCESLRTLTLTLDLLAEQTGGRDCYVELPLQHVRISVQPCRHLICLPASCRETMSGHPTGSATLTQRSRLMVLATSGLVTVERCY